MEWITALLATTLGKFGAGTLTGLVLLLLKKKLPGLLANMFGKKLDKMLDIKNQHDRELILNLVKWAEKRIGDVKGTGKVKYAMVAKKLDEWLPGNHEDRIRELIEAMVIKMKAELLERNG